MTDVNSVPANSGTVPPSSIKLNAKQVIDRLRVHCSKDKGYVFLEQVANTTGYSTRIADAIMMNIWRSRFEVIGIEVKVSRSDFLNEIKNPAKADKIFQYCDTWYIAAPHGMVHPKELPTGWGLLEIRSDRVFVQKASAKNKHKSLDDYFVASIIRRCIEQATPEADLAQANSKGYAQGRESARSQGKYELDLARTERDRLQTMVTDYEKASGLSFQNGWANGENIGAAVSLVLNGAHMKIRNRLIDLRDSLNEALEKLDAKTPT